MARIPEFTSTADISIQPRGTLRDPTAEAQGARDIQEIGRGISDFSRVWQDAIDFSETSKKQNDIQEGINDIVTRAIADPDAKNVNVYQEELRKIRSTAGEGFTSNLARIEFEAQASGQINQARVKIDGLFRGKMIDATKAEIIRRGQTNKAAYLQTGNKEFRQAHIDYIKEAREKGFLNEVFVANEETNIANWDIERAIKDAQTGNANQVIKDLQETDKYNIPVGKKADLLKKVKNIDKITKDALKRELRENQIQAELGVLTEFSEKGMQGFDFDNLRKMITSETVRPKFGEALGQYMFDPKVYNRARYKNKAFDGYIKNIMESDNKEQVNAVLETALDKTDVALDDLTVMIGLAIERSNTLNGLNENNGEVPKEKKSIIDRLKSLFNWTKDKEPDRSEAIRKYMEKTGTGKDPDEALGEVKQEIDAKNHPNLKNLPKEGKILTDKFGNTARVFPDGRIEEIK